MTDNTRGRQDYDQQKNHGENQDVNRSRSSRTTADQTHQDQNKQDLQPGLGRVGNTGGNEGNTPGTESSKNRRQNP